MARVTVEDCVTKIPNRFELVMTAAQRARDIAAGADLTMERDNDKNPVVALREIADQTVDYAVLQDTLVKGLQRYVESEDDVEDEMDMRALQQDMIGDGGEGVDAQLAVKEVSAEDVASAVAEAGAMMPAVTTEDPEQG